MLSVVLVVQANVFRVVAAAVRALAPAVVAELVPVTQDNIWKAVNLVLQSYHFVICFGIAILE